MKCPFLSPPLKHIFTSQVCDPHADVGFYKCIKAVLSNYVWGGKSSFVPVTRPGWKHRRVIREAVQFNTLWFLYFEQLNVASFFKNAGQQIQPRKKCWACHSSQSTLISVSFPFSFGCCQSLNSVPAMSSTLVFVSFALQSHYIRTSSCSRWKRICTDWTRVLFLNM